MSRIIDRRLNGKNKSTVNRQRFIKRFKEQIKSAVGKAISKRNITDICNSEKIIIPQKDISEPRFGHGKGGKYKSIHSGNKEFIPNDHIKRPETDTGQGTGNDASNSDEFSEDNFAFEISKDEFLELFFEDLKLPNLVQKELKQLETVKYVRAGYTTQGVPTNINILRSMKIAKSRKLAIKGSYKEKIKELEKNLDKLNQNNLNDINNHKISEIKLEIEKIKNKIQNIPFIDKIDIRYNNKITQKEPSSKAVMFCIMDVSGSMDEIKKDIAKRFFILLYLFLNRNYNKIELVFIRHHTAAKEVSEEDFFYSRETGGTVVSSALELMNNIIDKRYPPSLWNIYGAQASDGDNWNNDSPVCHDLLFNKILPKVQYFSYVEIMPRHHQSLWEVYAKIKNISKNFSMQSIKNNQEIYPVFRELFERKKGDQNE
tara:strand:- start:628 stop:1914 length:1287 start_codon:yes stop_codon:yes gene_type:complete